MVEGARLESVCTGNRTVGSNPTLSASLRSPEASVTWRLERAFPCEGLRPSGSAFYTESRRVCPLPADGETYMQLRFSTSTVAAKSFASRFVLKPRFFVWVRFGVRYRTMYRFAPVDVSYDSIVATIYLA